MSNVKYLPVWKQKATASERFDELASVAKEKPHEFEKVVVVYLERTADNCTVLRTIESGCSTHELLGMLTEAIHNTLLESKTV